MKYREENVPLVVLAGAEYGTGSSRDWAAKGTLLLGVRAVLAVSFERIHRSNLVGMGVLPLDLLPAKTWQVLGLTGEEMFDVPARRHRSSRAASITVRATAADGRVERVQRQGAHRYAGRARLLPQRRNPANRAAEAAWLVGPSNRSLNPDRGAARRLPLGRHDHVRDRRLLTLRRAAGAGSGNASACGNWILPFIIPAAEGPGRCLRPCSLSMAPLLSYANEEKTFANRPDRNPREISQSG